MEKIVKFNYLVANGVMLQNVLDMSAILRDLLREGYPVTLEAVQQGSTYIHSHIRRFGWYDVDVVPPPITEEMLTPLFPSTSCPNRFLTPRHNPIRCLFQEILCKWRVLHGWRHHPNQAVRL